MEFLDPTAPCARHGNPAHTTCRRCGAFVCPSCTNPCDVCVALLAPLREREAHAKNLGDVALATWVGGTVSMLLAAGGMTPLLLLAPIGWLIAWGLSVAALFYRSGTAGPLLRPVTACALSTACLLICGYVIWISEGV